MNLKSQKTVVWIFFSMTILFSNLLSSEIHHRFTSQRYNLYVSDEKKFVWVRVFKVASFTIKGLLKKNVLDLYQIRPKQIPLRMNSYFKFAFVRNPWDRIVSCYYHKVLTKKALDFKECFDKDFDYFVDFINGLDVASTNSHLKLQTNLIPIDDCDFIGRLETFEDDFKYVCSVIGISCDEIPHKHKTTHRHYSTYYTPRTKKIIADKYIKDIDAFGFIFEQETENL